MLASSVVLGPRLRGTEQRALSPLGDQAYSGRREVLAPISSTNTSRSVPTPPATVTFQAALSHSSRSIAPIVRFFG